MIKSILKKVNLHFLNDKKIFYRLFKTFIARGVSAVGTFFFNFALAKTLGVGEFGRFMYIYSIFIGLGFFARFGMSSAILRFASIMFSNKEFGKLKKLRKDVFKLFLTLSCSISILVIVINFIFIDYFFTGTSTKLLITFFAISLPFYSYLFIQASFLKAFKAPHIAPFIEAGLMSFIVGLVVVALDIFKVDVTTSLSAFIFLTSSIFISITGYFVLNKVFFNSHNYVLLEKYIGFYKTLPDYASSEIIRFFLTFSPTIIMGIFVSEHDIGIFSIANRTAFIINFILWIINTVYAPYFANFFENKEFNLLNKQYYKSILIMIIISFPLLIVFIIFPVDILKLFGGEFVSASKSLVILSISQFIPLLCGPTNFLLQMTGNQKKVRNLSLITLFLGLLLCFLLIPKYSYMGATIATSVIIVFESLVSFRLCIKYAGLSFFKMKL